jgi:DNA-binding response OmpR family regulator
MQCTEPKDSAAFQSILISDDDTVILDILAKGFKLYGFKVFTAENGYDGWNLFLHEHIDTVLTDIRMPGEFDGAELARRIREQSPETTIAVLTGGDSEIGSSLLKNGIVDYFFTKPFSLGYVCKTLSAKKNPAN